MTPSPNNNNSYKKPSLSEINKALSNINLVPNIQITDIITNCPYCAGKKFIKHAKYKGTFRFKCKSCNKTFLPSTGSSMHYINKRDKFIQYAEIMKNEGILSIARMAKRLNISIVTAFDWRHKILLSIPQQASLFNDELQCSNLWFLFSEKGRKGLKNPRKRGGSKIKLSNDYKAQLIASSDSKQVEMKLAKIGKITKEDLVRIMGNKISKETTLISDTHSCFVNFAEDIGLKHHRLISKKNQTAEGKTLQYVNDISERLKTWINRIMRGVSTKYLQLYANYFAFCEKNSFDALISSFINQKQVWAIYAQIEKVYEIFMSKYSRLTYGCPVSRKRKTISRFLVVDYWYPY